MVDQGFGAAGETALTMFAIGVTDFLYGHYANWTVEDRDLVHYLVDDRGGERSYFWAIFRRGASDALFYTAVGLAWRIGRIGIAAASEKEAAGFMFSISWVFRNAGHRFARIEIWYRLRDRFWSKNADKRTPITRYRDGEQTKIYVKVEQGQYQSAFVISWKTGEKRPLRLDAIMASIVKSVFDLNASWEERSVEAQGQQGVPDQPRALEAPNRPLIPQDHNRDIRTDNSTESSSDEKERN
jgi:hypothetical protein